MLLLKHHRRVLEYPFMDLPEAERTRRDRFEFQFGRIQFSKTLKRLELLRAPLVKQVTKHQLHF
jgi:hypothetical protein